MKTALRRVFLLALLGVGDLAVFAQEPVRATALPKLHVIYLLEQDNPKVGLLNLRNEELMNEITRTVAEGLDYALKLTHLAKRNFSQAALKRTIAGLQTGPRDIIILYYSGFGLVGGGNTGNFASWKLRDTPRQGLAVAEVTKWLWAKPVHLRLLIADCNARLLTNNKQHIAQLTETSLDLRKPVMQQLFLNTCGLVKMGSSRPSASSWTGVNTGEGIASAFTQSLTNAFAKLLSTQVFAEVTATSFQRLHALTKADLTNTLSNTRFRQVPVLEVSPCPNPVKRTGFDPLTTEMLGSMFNVMAANTYSMGVNQVLSEQLLRLSQPDATVEVSRYFIPGYTWQPDQEGMIPASDTSPDWKEDQQLHKTYSLKEYLAQVNKPLTIGSGAALQEFSANSKKVIITDKAIDNSAPKPLKRLVIRENYPGR